ncbi:MAG: COG1361 S-layer family protein [Candidatus Nanohaloarchaea archaeon]
MKTRKLLITAFTLLFIGAAASQTFQTRSTVGFNAVLVQTDPVPVQSGEDAEITFKIRNTGSNAAENVKLRIQDSFPFELKPDRQRNYSLGKVLPGQEYYVTTEVLVAENAPDGQNEFKVEVSSDNGVSVTEKIPVTVQSQDIKLNLANLKTVPETLTADTENAKLTVEAVNNGEKTAENVVLDLGLPEGFEKTSSFSSRQALGNIAPGQAKPATFEFDITENASKGGKQIPVDLSYTTGDSNNEIVEEAGFELFLSGKPRFEIVGVNSSLKTGMEKNLMIKVRNTGSEKASSTRIRVLDSSDLPFDYASATRYIGTLKPGQTGTAVFRVSTEASAPAKSYLLDFEIRGVRDTRVYVEDKTVKVGVENGEENSSPLPFVVVAVLAVIGAAAFYRREFLKQKVAGFRN